MGGAAGPDVTVGVVSHVRLSASPFRFTLLSPITLQKKSAARVCVTVCVHALW